MTQNLISEPFILNAEIIWEMTYPSQSLLRDEDTLWVGSHYGGLYKWDTTFGYQGSYTTTVGQDIVDLAQLGNGNIVAAALDGGLVAGNSQFTDITPSGLQTPWDLAVESDGTSYWVATRGQGIFHYQNDAWITYTTPAIPSNYVHAIALDSNDDPWIGTLGYGLATLAVVRCSSSSKSLAVAGLLTVPLSANKLFSSHSLLLEPMGKKSMNREPRLWLSV